MHSVSSADEAATRAPSFFGLWPLFENEGRDDNEEDALLFGSTDVELFGRTDVGLFGRTGAWLFRGTEVDGLLRRRADVLPWRTDEEELFITGTGSFLVRLTGL